MVMASEIQTLPTVKIKSVKIETPAPDDGFIDPHVFIYTEDETFIERLSDMLFFFRQNGLIRDFDQKALEVNPGDGWGPTFTWIFSRESLFQNMDVIGDWVAGRLARREQSRRAIEFFIHES